MANMLSKTTQANQKTKATFFVAREGNDTWSGKLAEPNADKTDGSFATLVRARDAIRKLKKEQGLKKPITVMVREGTYFLSRTLTFTPEDSGTKDCPITYLAYPGEKVILSGGKRITGPWKPYQDKIMVCLLPEAKSGRWKFRQLFFNGQRQIRARTPNYDPNNPLYGGWAFVEGPAIPRYSMEEPAGSKRILECRPGLFSSWKKPSQGEVNIFPRWDWWNNIISIKEVDERNHLITLAEDASYEICKGDRFRVENLLEELDQPGEWCLDTEEGKLYFWPPTGSVEKGEVIAPRLNRLISIQGNETQPVRYINILGFAFTQTLSEKFAGAVYLENTEDCAIKDNFFSAVGSNGVYLEGHNQGNQIVGNEFAYAGRGSIVLCGTKKKHPVKNTISHNHCHHCGVLYTGHGGTIHLSMSSHNLISHNLIHDLPRMGISAWDHGRYGGTSEDIAECGNNIVEYNELYHLNLETCDTGGIYTSYRGKRQEGNIIRYNIVRDIVGCGTNLEGEFQIPNMCWGIYVDGWTCNTTVYGNITIGNVNGGTFIYGGKNNVIENNILINSSKWQICYTSNDSWPGIDIDVIMSNNRFRRNIVYYTAPEAVLISYHAMLTDAWSDQRLAESDYNVFFHAGGKELSIEGVPGAETFAQWQKLGYDTHSLVADPLFVNLEKGDYRLKPNSPAFKLGFRPIDISKIGLKRGPVSFSDPKDVK